MSEKIKRILGNMHLRNKLILSFMIVAIIPMLILGAFSIYIIKDNLSTSKTKDMHNLLLRYENSIYEKQERISNSLDLIVLNQTTQKFLGETYEENKDYIKYYETVSTTLMPIIRAITQANPYFSSFAIYSISSIPQYDPYIMNSSLVEGEYWYQKSIKQEAFSIFTYYDKDYIYLTKKIIDFDTQKSVGILLAKVLKSEYFNFPYATQDGGYIEIYNKQDKAFEIGIKPKSFMKDSKLVGNTDLTINVYQSTSGISNASNMLLTTTILSIIICIIFIVILSCFLSKKITVRIDNILEKMRYASVGQLDFKIENNYSDEIGELSDVFTQMATKLNNLIEENYISNIRAKESELNALQSQIHPHFLYNTLSMIHWKAIDADALEISKIVRTLSVFYRTVLSSGKNTIFISDELSNLKSYIAIQQYMHGDKFDVEYNIEEGINNYKTVKFILQPFAENALEHGILCKENVKGLITINGYFDGEYIKFEICDNGIGMSEKTIIDVTNKDKQGYGIKNVYERLKIYYLEDCKLTIDSVEGQFTKVTIAIPAIL